jgi:hypothetical protein
MLFRGGPHPNPHTGPSGKGGLHIKRGEKNFLSKSLGSLFASARAFQVTRIQVECRRDERFVQGAQSESNEVFGRAEAAQCLQGRCP